MSTPPPKSHWTTMKPLHGQQLTIALRPTTCPVCLPVCCHWLPPFKAFSQSQGYDLCHVSFLRLFSAIPLIASCISGFRVSVVLHGCISRVHGGVFVFSHWSCVIGHHARASWCSNAMWVGGRHRVSSSRGARLHFGAVVVFVCFICGCIFGAPFLSSEWVVSFACCKRRVLPLACIFSTDFWVRLFFQWLFFGVVFQTFDSVQFLIFLKSMSYLWVAFFSTDF